MPYRYGYCCPPPCPVHYGGFPGYCGGNGSWFALFIILFIIVLIFGGWWYFNC